VADLNQQCASAMAGKMKFTGYCVHLQTNGVNTGNNRRLSIEMLNVWRHPNPFADVG
jgi:hypothetical protein